MSQELFGAIFAGHDATRWVKYLESRDLTLHAGMVEVVGDPLFRVKASLPSKGAKTLTDWLLRVLPFPGLCVPDLQKGDTVIIGFIDGDPHSGFYLGVPLNMVNQPDSRRDRLTYRLGNSVITVEPQQIVLQQGASTFVLTDKGLAINGVDSVTINGRQVATLGATDTDGDRLVSKGW